MRICQTSSNPKSHPTPKQISFEGFLCQKTPKKIITTRRMENMKSEREYKNAVYHKKLGNRKVSQSYNLLHHFDKYRLKTRFIRRTFQLTLFNAKHNKQNRTEKRSRKNYINNKKSILVI